MYLRHQRALTYMAVVFGLCLAPCSVLPLSAGPKPNPMENADVKRGAGLFQQSCASCHGEAARGGMGPSLIDSSLVRHDVNGDLITKVLQNGRPDNGMPAFPALTNIQIMEIVAFLHARIQVTNSVESSGPAGGYSVTRLMTGSAQAGKQYFNGKGHCSSCHSSTGDLAGIATKYSPVDLELLFLYPQVDNVTATVISLRSGQAVKGKLLHLDAFYVAIVDSDGSYRSWPIDAVKVEVNDPLKAHRELLDKYENKDIHDIFAYLETFK